MFEGTTELFKEEIAGFKNYKHFGQNYTISGANSCYFNESKVSVEEIKEMCISKAPENEDWVLILPFDNIDFVTNLNTVALNFPKIKGFIFTYFGNPQITSPAPDSSSPLILSFAKRDLIEKREVAQLSYPNSEKYKIYHDHVYIQYCDVMIPSEKYYVIAI